MKKATKGKKARPQLFVLDGSLALAWCFPGNCKGMLTVVADDDEHLKDFAEYLG